MLKIIKKIIEINYGRPYDDAIKCELKKGCEVLCLRTNTIFTIDKQAISESNTQNFYFLSDGHPRPESILLPLPKITIGRLLNVFDQVKTITKNGDIFSDFFYKKGQVVAAKKNGKPFKEVLLKWERVQRSESDGIHEPTLADQSEQTLNDIWAVLKDTSYLK